MTDASPLKSSRLEFRVTPEQKRAIEEAASIEGRSVTDFSSSTLVEHAREVIQRERQILVDSYRFDEFSAVMDRPARTIDGLRELMRQPSVFVD